MSQNLDQGKDYIKNGNIEEAESFFETILKREANNLDVLNYLGIISFQKRNPDKSINFFIRALTIDPYHKNSVLNICEVCKSIDRLYMVKSFLDKIIEQYPDDDMLTSLLREVENSEKKNINTEGYWDTVFTEEVGKREWRRNVICFGKIKSVLGILGHPGDTLIDIGCGYGLLLDQLSPLGFQLSGWDISQVAAERITAKGYHGRQLDFTRFEPSDNDQVDHVITTEFLEHVYDPYEVLGKIYRLAKKTIIIAVPDNCLEDEEEHLQCFDTKQVNELAAHFQCEHIFIDNFTEEYLFAREDGTNGLIQRPTILVVMIKH